MAELIYDSFRIKDKYHLNSEDYNNLSQLYLPIMGIDSFSLYIILNGLDTNKEYAYKHILDLLANFSLANLNQAFDKLEALCLVKTYYNKKSGYLHEVYPPLSQKDFLANELLSSCLASQIGMVAMEELAKGDSVSEGYKDISKKIEDVFSIDVKSNESIINSLFKPDISVDNKDFNYVLFKAMFDGAIPDEVLEDSEFKKHILRIAFTYKLNVDEMHECVIKTMTIDKNLEYASISKNAKMAFQNKYDVKNPVLKAKSDDKYLGSIKDDAWFDLLNSVENMSISDVLQSLSGIRPSVAEISMFEKLQNNTGFPNGVINLMIILVNKEKNGELPTYNYFEKIANTWARAKIKSAYDVLKYYETRNENDKVALAQTVKRGKAKQPVIPSWYQDYKNELDSNENKPMNEEQTKQMVDLIKDLFNDEE